MDILEMTVGECMKDPCIKELVERYIPEISKFPVKLFSKKSCGELINMGLKQELFTQADADYMVGKINEELAKLK